MIYTYNMRNKIFFEPTILEEELREILFNLDNQKMTVEQLRSMLFNVSDQDAEIDINFSMFKKIESENRERSA